MEKVSQETETKNGFPLKEIVIIGSIIILFLIMLVTKNPTIKIVLAVITLYRVASLKSIKPDEIGALLLFGRIRKEYKRGAGLVEVPLLICKLSKTTALVIQHQYPGEPEEVDKTGSDTIAPGKVAPIRVTTSGSNKVDEKDPLSQRLTIEVSIIVRKRIKEGEYETFLKTIGSIEAMEQQIRDTVEAEVKVQFPGYTPSEILKNLQTINDALKVRVQNLTSNWGVEIVDVDIVDLDLNHQVNKSMSNVTASLFEKQATIVIAEAQKQKLTLEGEGIAAAQKALLEAKAIGMSKLAEITKTPEGQIAMWLNALEIGFKESKHTIIPGGKFFEALGGIQSLLEQTKTKEVSA